MKKISVVSIIVTVMLMVSCGSPSGDASKTTDSSASKGSGSPDSSANNGVLPPSASPSNASNSSLADTTYHAKDSLRK